MDYPNSSYYYCNLSSTLPLPIISVVMLHLPLPTAFCATYLMCTVLQYDHVQTVLSLCSIIFGRLLLHAWFSVHWGIVVLQSKVIIASERRKRSYSEGKLHDGYWKCMQCGNQSNNEIKEGNNRGEARCQEESKPKMLMYPTIKNLSKMFSGSKDKVMLQIAFNILAG